MLDTNVLLATARNNHAKSLDIENLDRWQRREFQLLVRLDTLSEYAEKLRSHGGYSFTSTTPATLASFNETVRSHTRKEASRRAIASPRQGFNETVRSHTRKGTKTVLSYGKIGSFNETVRSHTRKDDLEHVNVGCHRASMRPCVHTHGRSR